MAKIAPAFLPTEPDSVFKLGDDTIIVRVENSNRIFAWQLIVNGSKSRVTSYYQGVLLHKGYAVTTDYWDGTFPVFVPFKITPTKGG